MKTICLYFQIHLPIRFRRYRFFDIGADSNYYDHISTQNEIRRIANECYLPANKVLSDAIKMHKGKFKVAFSISGLALEQLITYAPEVIESFKKLNKTQCVEFYPKTYSHSLVSLKNKELLEHQIKRHNELIKKHFNQSPTVFRNTELIYSDEIGNTISELGFKAMLSEEADCVLGNKSPNHLYSNAINPRFNILLRNSELSNDIALRFSDRDWKEHPLTSEKMVSWIMNTSEREELFNLFMNYETFGINQKASSGVLSFLSELSSSALAENELIFSTPSEVVAQLHPVSAIHVTSPVSWSDNEQNIFPFLGNELQEEAFNQLYNLYPQIKKCSDFNILKDWDLLQMSDHFYYMCTNTKAYTSTPYDSPYDAFINYMNILSDFTLRLNKAVPNQK